MPDALVMEGVSTHCYADRLRLLEVKEADAATTIELGFLVVGLFKAVKSKVHEEVSAKRLNVSLLFHILSNLIWKDLI